MHFLTALNTLLVLASPISPETEKAEVKPVDFQIGVYPFGGVYADGPCCPRRYPCGPGRCGPGCGPCGPGVGVGVGPFGVYVGPGPGCGPRCYDRPYYYDPYYRRPYRYYDRW